LRQYISNKKVCESNKADSQAQIDGFYLCHIELTIPYLKCIAPCGRPGWADGLATTPVGADNVLSKITTDYETGLCAAMASSIIQFYF
jgi:hypothetical protein